MTLNDDADGIDLTRHRLHVGLEGAFGDLHVTPRSLSAKHLSHMVCLDGIVTSCSLIRPKLMRSVHWSETGKTFLAKEYQDATMVLPGGTASGNTSNNSYPTQDDQHGRLTSEYGLSTYRDYQSVTVQEMPERAPPGQLPRSVDVILDQDLVDTVKPGDRARVVGVYRGMAGSIVNQQVPSLFRAVLVANSVRPIAQSSVSVLLQPLTTKEAERVQTLSKSKDVLDQLSIHVAPSIHGHDHIKRAILLQQVGGVEQNLQNGTHIRGDINIMMVGDPSTAKSQMLRYVLGVAPLAVATTGRGSSGVGLTAAVVSDRETGERRLEAGAMVLADRGIVCIDEFDKMSDQDRVAIHEVMEQQTVTIAKAGIHTTLNARCSVLAAANPVFGQYVESKSPQDNIRLPDSLLSRFDLLFIVLDKADPDTDRRIAEHVLRMHRYQPAGYADGAVVPDRTTIYADADTDADASGNDRDFIKKYIQHAKQVKPVLSASAIEVIVEAYCDFRQQREQHDLTEQKTFPVTARTLETLIRLSAAHAKLRLSNLVVADDAQVAVDLVEYCLYKEVKRKPRKLPRQRTVISASDGYDGADGDSDGDQEKKESSAKGKEVSQELQDLILTDLTQQTQSHTQSQTQTQQEYGLVGTSTAFTSSFQSHSYQTYIIFIY